ncbi:MAG: lysophospholipid acyltransferase family protein [Desulfotalea sp.]
MSRETQNAKSWSSKSLAGHWRHNFFYMLIRYTGRVPAYLFSYIVVFFYIFFSRTVYRRTEPYIRRRFPQAGVIKKHIHSWKLCQKFAVALIDKSAISIIGRETFSWDIKNGSQINEILKDGNGLIILTSHTGCWQAAIGGLSDVEAPVHLMIHRDDGDIDKQYFEKKSSSHIHTIPVDDPLAGIIKTTKALRSNEIVSIMGDRIFPPTSYVGKVNFLGDKALFPTAAYKIAQSTGAPIVMLLTRKVGLSTMFVEITKPIYVEKKRGADLSLYAQKTADVLEEYIQISPYQFYNFLDLWSSDDE